MTNYVETGRQARFAVTDSGANSSGLCRLDGEGIGAYGCDLKAGDLVKAHVGVYDESWRVYRVIENDTRIRPGNPSVGNPSYAMITCEELCRESR